MPVFQYEAMDSRGQEVRAEVEAGSQKDAIDKIRSQGQFPTQVRLKGKGGRKAASVSAPKRKGKSFTIGRVSAKDLTQFTRQLSVLQDAGLPLLRSLRILENQTSPGVLKNALQDIIEDVEAGSTLSEAMEKHPKAFDSLYVHTVRAGEAGGVLDQILRRLAEFMEKAQALKKKVVGALVYPALVISVAAIIVFVIVTWLVPKFEKIFKNFQGKDATLPAPTEALIAVSDVIGDYWYLIPGVLVGGFVLFRAIKASRAGRYWWDWLKMKIPIVSGIVKRTAVARFSRTLGTLIAAGVPILEALNITRETVGNEVMAKALGEVHDSIREGESIADPLRQSGVVDPIVVNMVDVGEETGELDQMLIRVADTYDEEVDYRVAGMVNALEPIMIVFLGLTIGGIVICLFLPMVELMQSLGNK